MDGLSSSGGGPRAAGSSVSVTSERSGSASAAEAVSGCRFPKSCRLRKRSEFQRVYDQGKRWNCPLFSVVFAATATGLSRVGLTVPRALGKAVVRNRIRRRMREAVRQELWRLQPAGNGKAWDFVFHPRKPVLNIPMSALRGEVERVFSRCATS